MENTRENTGIDSVAEAMEAHNLELLIDIMILICLIKFSLAY